MDDMGPLSPAEDNEAIIVKADEVDEAGADISTISPTDTSESEFTDRIEMRRALDAQAGGSPKILANAMPSPPRPLSRPVLRREGSAPGPPQQPPAPPPKQYETSNASDSLSLLQLKRLVTDLPRTEPTAYAYDYAETRSFPEELQEWFQYSEQERHILLRAKHTFEQTWEQAHSERPESSDKALEWTDVEEDDRTWFIQCAIKALDSNLPASRIKSLECISYVVLGAWDDTAGVDGDISEDIAISDADAKWFELQKAKSNMQFNWIVHGARILLENGAFRKLVKLLSQMWKSEQSTGVSDSSDSPAEDFEKSRMKQLELDHILTTLYVLVEAVRWQSEKDVDYAWREEIANADPNLLSLITRMVAKLRWEDLSEPTIFSRQRLFLLLWKTSLLLFGNFEQVEETKVALRKDRGMAEDEHDESFITATPLDYHLFRQEITSKYPAYSPPQPLVPIELENNSILPPLSNHPIRQASQDNIQNLVGNNSSTGSIFNQPVHIATPAPSPPPSPAGPGGKSGKKQNYQTNQNFPFLYPPLGVSKDTIENQSKTPQFRRVQDSQWDNSDVPASILEAGSLFASRMRMSRSLQQLWDVREEFIRAERGWNESLDEGEVISDEESLDEEEVEQLYLEERRKSMKKEAERDLKGSEGIFNHNHPGTQPLHEREVLEKDTGDSETERRLKAINQFYRDVLPDLQSFVIVLFKELFQNVQALIVQNGPNGTTNGVSEDGGNDGPSKRKTNPNSSASLNGMANGHLAVDEDGTTPAVEGLNEVRSREISSKAVSGILLVLLKWFRLSHIIKFEYLTQLLLDANFLPLVLKFFAHQDVDKAVEHKNDREDLDFFSFCRLHSKHPPSSKLATAEAATAPEPALSSSPSSSEDEAVPPPISKHRRSPTDHSPPPTPPPPTARPEVDELGFPTSGNLPQTPLTNFAPRFFLTNINLLRLLQKITKRKAHRALLLVQYKSSTILRKALKIPQPSLRLYTLKLFKSQVPYCGRKWRQTNMRVITAIYLHCRPELRDEWLCGGDVDGVVEEALPLEQAGRGLVHWWHLRNFRDVMEGDGGNGGVEREEYDFFARELNKMGWGVGGTMAGMVDEDDGVEGLVAAQAEGRSEFEGGVLQMEGWA